MQEISNLSVYTGIIPNKATQTDNEFANNIFGFLNYSGNTFVGNFNTIITQFNVLSGEINTAATEVKNNKIFVSNAKTSIEQTAAVLANGTINDTTTGVDKTYSSNKLDELFNDRYKKEETYSKVQVDTNIYTKTQVDTNIYTKTQVDTNIYTKTQVDTRLNSHIPLSAFTSYNLLDGNLSVGSYVTQKAVDTFLYTGNTTTLPTINLGMNLESQWGNTVNETYGYIIEFKPRSIASGWTKVNSINGRTKYLDSSSVAIENTDANLFTLSTVAGNTKLNIGTSARVNTNGVTYFVTVWQLTHKITGTTAQGKSYAHHYNPTTGTWVQKITGGIGIGEVINTHNAFDVGTCLIKDTLNAVQAREYYGDKDNYLILFDNANATSAKVSATNWFADNKNGTITLNYTLAGTVLLFGDGKAYIDESGKLIGNCEIGTYGGSGVAGNEVMTKGKPYRLEIKSISAGGLYYDWRVYDNKKNYMTYLNLSSVEDVSTVTFSETSFTLPDNAVGWNASGVQYLYKVYYDTNANGSGGYYNKATDNANVQVNNAIIPLPLGIDSNGIKNSIVIVNETVTGVRYTEGKNYLYKTDTGYGVSAYKPRYLKSELVREFDGDQPEYFDIGINKWFSCDKSELIKNGDFSLATDWTLDAGWSISDGAALFNSASGSYIRQSILCAIGAKYKIMLDISVISGSALIYNNGVNISTAYTVSGKYFMDFVAQKVENDFRVVGYGGSNFSINNISVATTEITPISEIVESRNYMNHIVHADASGNPLFVEELPKIKYENKIKADEFQGRNTCTAYAKFDVTTTIPTKLEGFNADKLLRTGTGEYDFYTEIDYENLNAVANVGIKFNVSNLGNTNAIYQTTLNKFHITHVENGISQNGSIITIHIFGGKN
jgi:hypothetical protein